MSSMVNSIGQLSKTAISESLIDQTIDFIWNALLPWKDDIDRPVVEAEEDLNAQVQNFLQSLANEEFPMVNFQHEQRQKGRRKVDLAVKPIKRRIIKGVSYSKYDPIIVLEGKRLPAPSKAREREYVTGDESQSGGIQRFKLGVHGSDLETVILLGYIQKKSMVEWHDSINGWITELADKYSSEWGADECLTNFENLNSNTRARSVSMHPRPTDCRTAKIRIHHFWIECSMATE